MKNPSSHGQIQTKSRLPVLLMLAGALVMAGCSKSKEVAAAPTPPPSEQDTNPAAAPVYTRPTTPTVLAVAPSGEPDLKAMTHSLRGWIARTHRVPADLADYEAQANVQFPAAPAGKKFAIGKRMTIVLVSQ
jgi:hypothetical protein